MQKTILLIGGSYGIAKAVVASLHNEANLIVASRTNDELNDYNVTHIPFDANTDTLDITALPEKIDGFVFGPGSINLRPFKMLSPEAYLEDFNINFMALVKCLKTIMPLFNEGASLVFFSTVAVKTGMPFHTSVSAAKGAIEGFAKSLAAEYAPKLRVNVVAPSLTNTPLAKRLLNNDAKKEKMADRHPLKNYGEPEDVAQTAVFLLSDKSKWITGQIIGVDGGISTLNLN